MSAHVLTIIFAAVLLYAAVSGWIKGLFGQIGQIAGLIIGVLASRALSPGLINMLDVDAGAEKASTITAILCYILVFLAAYFIVVLVAKVLKIVVKAVALGFVDRLGGALFKMLKWMLILSLFYNLAVAIKVIDAPTVSNNLFERIIYHSAPKVLDMCYVK